MNKIEIYRSHCVEKFQKKKKKKNHEQLSADFYVLRIKRKFFKIRKC